jgi:hypothetical protein
VPKTCLVEKRFNFFLSIYGMLDEFLRERDYLHMLDHAYHFADSEEPREWLVEASEMPEVQAPEQGQADAMVGDDDELKARRKQ